MTAMPPLRDVLNDTPANAIDVEFNFQTIEAHIAQELINRDGTVSMVQPLTLAGPAPSAPNHAVTKGYADTQIVPIGTVWQFAGSAAPTGWAFCDGSSKSTTDPLYAALFAVVGYTYGGSGANFNLPDLRGRAPFGRHSGQTPFDTLGEKGGSRDLIVVTHGHDIAAHTHTTPNHIHPLDHNHALAADAAKSTGTDHTHSAAPGGAQFFTRVPGAGLLGVASVAGTEQWWSQTQTAISGAHTHDVDLPAFTGDTPSGGGGTSGSKALTTDDAGASGVDKNLPPYIVLNYMIRIG